MSRHHAGRRDVGRRSRTAVSRPRAQRSAELFGVFRDDRDARRVPRRRPATGWSHLHLPLVEHCARRFRNRGEPYEDLVQVGTIGLIKSIDRFDTDRGVEFSTYATPTIIGEIKRYFRDKGWAIRVPRRLQELRMQIGTATAELTQKLGRSPTPRELAERDRLHGRGDHRGDRVQQRLLHPVPRRLRRLRRRPAAACSTPSASTTRASSTSRSASRSSRCSSGSTPREKRILLLRFFKNMTQSQIAEEIGVSQMHVSRLLNRTLDQLRASLEAASSRDPPRRGSALRRRGPRRSAGARSPAA